MSLSKKIIDLSEKMRPVLVKVVPMKLLRYMKDKVQERELKRMQNRRRKPYEPGHYEPGINLIGCIRAEIGLGQSCRLLADELEHTGISYMIRDFLLDGKLRAEEHSWDHKIEEQPRYGINLLHIEPLDLIMAYMKEEPELWDYRYNIAFWLWELEEFPQDWMKSLDLVDEIWTPSEFTSSCIRKVTDKPVITIPYCVTAPTEPQYNRAYFKLPEDRFLFLVMYDTNSTMDRKNPVGALKAFCQAFSPEDQSVGLVLKMNNPRKEDLDVLQEQLKEYSNIYYITEVMDKVVVNSLIREVDVFVSLHRAEGFGLVMAEAMLNGTPCIATDWSSNTEFMNSDVACMVDYTFTTLEKSSPPYEKGARWADANIDTAAAYMKKLKENPEYYRRLAENGKAYIEEKLGMEQAVRAIKQRVGEIEHDFT